MRDDVAQRLRELAEELESSEEEDGEPLGLVDRAVEEAGFYSSNDLELSEDIDGAVEVSYNGKADATIGELNRLRESDWYLHSVTGDSLIIRPEDHDDD